MNSIKIKNLSKVANICNQILREVWKSKKISIAHVIMRRGNVSLLHKHKTFTELYYFLEGRGVLSVGNQKIKVGPETLVEIKPNTFHKLENTEKSRLVHLVISTPAFNPKDVLIQ